ncbi:MAG TPA: retroviral-like aspartic protease family protein [Candidatus Acidoferrales bacterium]|nr:retroviral-like aspartic protease family protein [Candidatus Acidoferrales bacterium]
MASGKDRESFRPFSVLSVCLFLLFYGVADAASASTLVVKKDQARLRAQQEERSETLATLKVGDKLTPLANALGNETWYLARTENGVIGWVRAADVEGTEALAKVVQESDKSSATISIPEPGAPPPQPRLDRETTVPIVFVHGVAIVPVEINRSVKTYMVMDTGASFTQVTPGLAKRLGLQLGPRVAGMLANGTVSHAPISRLGSLRVGGAEAYGLLVTVREFRFQPTVEGLLGLNFLSRFHTSIDSKKQLLTLAPR